MIQKIKKLVQIRPIFNDHKFLNNHFVITTESKKIFSLTHNKETYLGIKNTLISEKDINGMNRKQYIIPCIYYYDETTMRLVKDKRADAFLEQHKDKLQEHVNLIIQSKIDLKDIGDLIGKDND